MPGVTRPSSAPRLGIVFLVLAAAHSQIHPGTSPTDPSAVGAVTQRAAPDSLTATVRYVHPRGIDVITGVQFALQLTYIALDPTTVVRKQGRTVRVDALAPGDLVTIQYEESARGKLARRIVVRPLTPDSGQ